ncbi:MULTISPECIES: type II secretion system F family protein [unclassified Cryobacterium]|uniref:type II secretion system F family protein n=1 Tax=unclassified Cryobacterium TaxID=2649013 RepID=UPI002AB54ED7|nr:MULTISPECIES: type II secretion system F family protein [unclassified Cryobacterium]MDY7540935.1 type II secretion system F family protein [Cryobacterium sp. 5B3]MEA9998950.1 type II secretion system F family protein [Cryobacterium sp. RTS3]MEB0265907.1 type II secretion system F family protein [Cryobacterium sp. 10I5]MEB0274842.1 type II secretion system F family protein [Cryobacterium sp. 5B3]
MRLVLGCLLGAGLLLMAAPFLWPRRRAATGVPDSDPSPADGETGRPGQRGLATLRGVLAQAGLGSLPLPAFSAISLLLGLACAALAEALIGVRALALVAGLVGALTPTTIVLWRARERRRSNRTVWPDVVDHLVSAVRSGLALPDSVSTLAESGPVPTRAAFADFARDYRATGSFGYSVDRLKAGLADPVADRILETLRMAREVGGSDLTLVLRDLAAWLRQDAAIRAEVEARQSWVVNAARLGVAAPWIVLLLLSSRPEGAVAYNTGSGVTVIVSGLAVSVIAYRLMVFIGRLPEERRWFR